VAARLGEPPKGEITLVVAGSEEPPVDESRAGKAAEVVAELVAAGMPRRRAAELVARLTGLSRNSLYSDSL
jgi:16S rRNA (cytidine1402-2'-O)-methyltransferase